MTMGRRGELSIGDSTSRKRKGGESLERSGGATISTDSTPLDSRGAFEFDSPSCRSIKRDAVFCETNTTLPTQPFCNDREQSSIFFLCSDISCQPLKYLLDDDETESTTQVASSTSNMGNASSIFERKIDTTVESPSSVFGLPARDPNNIHFWQRSLAWDDQWSSDDEQECERQVVSSEDVHHKLQLPLMQVKAEKRNGGACSTVHSLKPLHPRSKIRRFSRRKKHCDAALDTKDRDTSAEIYWEERIDESVDLAQLASKLTISCQNIHKV